MIIKYELDDIDKCLPIYFELRGVDHFDAIITMERSEKQRFWIDQETIDRVMESIDYNNATLVSDYDADGISSVGVAMSYNHQRPVIVPERSWGYGITNHTISRIADNSSIITADCGISNYDEIEQLKSRGVKVVVTDHHQLGDNMPQCMIIHPKLHNSSFHGYSGAGVLYKLMSAIHGDNDDAVQYAAIGTIADVMPVLDENRIIIRNGINKIRNNPAIPIAALLRELKKSPQHISVSDIGFYVGPAINSCGRLGATDIAKQWVLSTNGASASNLAKQIARLNTERREKTLLAQESASVIYDGNIVVVELNKKYLGLAGIVANQFLSAKKKSAVVIVDSDNGATASIRTIKSVDANHIARLIAEKEGGTGGGHKNAAGVKITGDNAVTRISNACIDIAQEMPPRQAYSELTADFGVSIELLPEIARLFRKITPFGHGMESPIFGVRIPTDSATGLGENKSHTKITVGDVTFTIFNKSPDDILRQGYIDAVCEIDFDSVYRGTQVIVRGIDA